MLTSRKLTKVFNKALKLPLTSESKIILMSDCHRGDGSWSDDFSKNQNIYFRALSHYYNSGFTYIEIGDGDELWENKNPREIIREHNDVYFLLSDFARDNRLYLIYGNHDMCKKNCKEFRHHFYSYYDDVKKKELPLLKDIEVYEGIVLQNMLNDQQIFLVHGHQGDLLNDNFWKVSRFLVRYLWRNLQLIGVKTPGSVSKNYKKKIKVERNLSNWVKVNKKMLISGHTHRSIFPSPNEVPYFNDGCCVHPRCITGIEIEHGRITLIKWSVKTKEDGTLYIARDILEGPEKISSYYIPK